MEGGAMALSMDEQRMLAEIEARLTAEDPRLAARMSSFRRPGSAARLRTPRGKLMGSVFALALAVVISVMVYAMIPFRVHSPGRGAASPLASGSPSAAAPVRPAGKPAAASPATAAGARAPATGASTAAAVRAGTTGTASGAGTPKAGTPKAVASKAGTGSS
jgi:hypothetical protein